MATVIDTSTENEPIGYSTQRHIDRTSNGVLWVAFWNGAYSTTQAIEFWYSTDEGATWAMGSTLGFTSTTAATKCNLSFYIDSGDNAYIAYKEPSSNNIVIRRATPNAARTSWTWGGKLSVSTNSTDNYPDIVAHPEGTGFAAHVVYSRHAASTGSQNAVWHHLLKWDSAGTFLSNDGTTLGYGYLNDTPKWPSIDFYHNGDGKTVKGGTPHLYVSWSAGDTGAGKGIRFKRAAYSAGSWTWGTEREIDPDRYILSPNADWLNCVFDGSRVILAGILVSFNRDLIIYERNEADTATTVHVRVVGISTAEILYRGSASFDGDGNVHLVGNNGGEAAGANDIVRRRWNRSGRTLEAETVLDANGDGLNISLKRGYSDKKIEWAYVKGTGPYSILYDSLGVNRAPSAPGAFTDPTSGEVHDASVPYAHGAGSDPDGDAITYDVEYSTDNGATYTRWATSRTTTSGTMDSSAWPATTTARIRARSKDPEGLVSGWTVSPAFTIQHNVAPNAPPIVGPKNNQVIDRTSQQVFDWDFSDPDAGDSQSAYQIAYRAAGTTTWSYTNQIVSTSTQHTFAANFWGAGDWEWRVRTADAQGVWGPYSSSAFFTAADPPPTPSITEPLNGSTISSESGQVKWSAPSQTHFQVRKVADNAGSPDATTVYYDSGQVASTSARNHALSFPVNGRSEHIQVRIMQNGLWSAWASILVHVDYTEPATPTIIATASDAAGLVEIVITNPTPSGTQPPVIHNDLERRELGQGEDEWIRIVAEVGVNGTYRDRMPASGVTHEYRVIAHGDNGTSSVSSAAVATLILRYSWIHRVSDPAGTIRQLVWNNTGGQESYEPELGLLQFAGRKYPVAEFGEAEIDSVSVSLDLDGPGEVEYLRELVRAKEIVCYRDSSGRKVIGIIPGQGLESRFYGGSTTLEVVAVDYSEEV